MSKTGPPVEETWRDDACRAIEDAGGTSALVEQLRSHELDRFAKVARRSLSSGSDGVRWSDTQSRLQKTIEAATDLVDALQSLTEPERKLLQTSWDPFDETECLEQIGMKRLGDRISNAVWDALKESPRDEEKFKAMRAVDDCFNDRMMRIGYGDQTKITRWFPTMEHSSEETLADELEQFQETIVWKLELLSEVVSTGPGRGDLQTRLIASPRKIYVRECAKLFERAGLPVTDGEGGPFFRFCAAIYDHAAGDAVFSRDKHFREVAHAIKAYRAHRAKVQAISDAMVSLPGETNGGFSTVDEAHLPEFVRLSDRRRLEDDRMHAAYQEIWGRTTLAPPVLGSPYDDETGAD